MVYQNTLKILKKEKDKINGIVRDRKKVNLILLTVVILPI